MTLYVRNASVWVTPKQIYRNNAGTWQQVQKVYARNAGVWTLQYVNVVISANTSDYNLYTALGSPTTPVTVYATINTAVEITASTTSTYAFTVGSFPAGSKIYLVNNGYIVGKGGTGLGKSSTFYFGLPIPATANGGPALNANFAISIDNTNGTVGGGGGGGGAGGAPFCGDCSCSGCGGGLALSGQLGPGGGGAGYGPSSSGATGYQANTSWNGFVTGVSGTLLAGGGAGSYYGGPGGTLGTAGTAGQMTGSCCSTGYDYIVKGTAGGTGGACTLNNANITWVATGNRFGTLG